MNTRNKFLIGEQGGAELYADKDTLIKLIHDCLCDGLHYFSSYGIEVKVSKRAYNDARTEIKQEGVELCYEDVWIQVLKDGGSIAFIDVENAGDMTGFLSLSDSTLNNFAKVPFQNIINLLNEEYDAGDCDTILQTLVWGEVVFG